MTLPLTKTLDPADYEALKEELAIVDGWFTADREQHPARRWEYAMALRAIATWQSNQKLPYARLIDVGGAGSPFFYMVPDHVTVKVIDPDANTTEHSWEERWTLEEKIRMNPRLRDIVVCLSVLEHVDDLDQFLYHLSCLVAPGGLLFLTMDCWDQEGPDTAHFHWDRKRIFSMSDWLRVSAFFVTGIYRQYADFSYLGEQDRTYHGHQLFGSYSFCSLALVKRS